LKKTKKYGALFIFLFMVLCIAPDALYSKSFRETSHGDRRNLSKGCQSCHKGHGEYNTPMLPRDKDLFCFRCHGNSASISMARREGDIGLENVLLDIRKEFEKLYRHPIEKKGVHTYRETLPETDPSMPRHAECVDCHHHHYVTKENKHLGLNGTNFDSARVLSIVNEYELCFNCHSYSANLPSDQTNKAELFNISNPSYHPVIGPGKNHFVPSLQPPMIETVVIKCTDCHNNNDPLGPKGPHGSDHKYLLKKNFNDHDGAEGVTQYDLCYSCHSRASILGNESFQYHNLHISVVGTSCRTCHNPHGSTQYSHLIDFTSFSISPSAESGALNFRDLGDRAGECFLSCHGKDHNPGSYPAAVQPVSTQQSPFSIKSIRR
jgi:predicted CXXCH cytochrome family protein